MLPARHLRNLTLVFGLTFVFTLNIITTYAADAKTPPAKKNKLIYGVHFSSTMGQSAAKLLEITEKMTTIIVEATGVNMTVERFSSPTEVAEAFLRNEVDIAGLYGGQIIEIIERGGDATPYATCSIDGKQKYATCLWQKKDSDIHSASDVIGKRLIGRTYEMPFPYLSLRDYLFEQGIDKPLWEVFKTFTFVQNENSGFMALAAGDADIKWSSEDFKYPLKIFMPQVQSLLTTNLCSEPVFSSMSLTINNSTVDEDTFNIMKSKFPNIVKIFNEKSKKDPDFKMAKQYMKLLNVNIVLAENDQLKYETELYVKAKDRGWMSEAQFMIDKISDVAMGPPIEIKPDMEYCKKKCVDKDAECVLGCLK